MINLSRRYLIIFGIVLLLVAVALCVTMLLGFAVGQETRRTAEELAKVRATATPLAGTATKTAQELDTVRSAATSLAGMATTTAEQLALDNVLFVKPGASGNCRRWRVACDLATALDQAMAGDEIWVAKGIYTPTLGAESSDLRAATFQLQRDVALYGGFVGIETSREQRDWKHNITILSGDIGDNDIKANGVITDTKNIKGTNSYHVVTVVPSDGVTQTAVLDGFTITGGNANGTVAGSRCGPACGGGIYNDGGSPTLVHVRFVGNKALASGGGMWNYKGSPELSDVHFDANTTETRDGGGMCNDARSSPTLVNVTFSRNEAGQHGGGIYNQTKSNPTLVNVTFSKNEAGRHGGGIYNQDESSPTLVNVTFSKNEAGRHGGGIYNGDKSSLELTNCILWGNTAKTGPQIFNDDTSSAALTYSDIQGGWTGTGNIDADPLFVDPDRGVVRLGEDSDAIDKGDNDAVPADIGDLDGDGNSKEPIPFDLDGNPRICGEAVDMGAYEHQFPEGCPTK